MEFLEKYVKDETKRKKYCTIGGILLAISAVIIAASAFLISNFNFHLTTEAGNIFDVNKVWKKDFKAFCTVAGDIDTETVGNYKCLVKVWGLIPMNVTVDVVDTTAPVLALQEFAANYGGECKPEDFILQSIDKSEVTYEFETKGFRM